MRIEGLEYEKGKGFNPGSRAFAFMCLVGFVAYHILLIYVMASGDIVGRGTTVKEGRESAPLLFWTYFIGLALPAVLLDVYLLSRLINHPQRPHSDVSEYLRHQKHSDKTG